MRRRGGPGQAGLAARCWRLHAAELRGDGTAARALDRLSRSGWRAGQCMIDVTMGYHRHPDGEACDNPACPEAADGVAWAASWEAYWPPGQAAP